MSVSSTVEHYISVQIEDAGQQYRSYKYLDNICRGCKNEEEVLSHVVNCGFTEKIDIAIIESINGMDEQVKLN